MNPEKQSATIVVAIIFGFILHILSFIYFRKKGMIADIDASVKEERTQPYLVSILFYLAGFLVLSYYDVDIISRAFWFCYITNTILITIINKHWKISAHAMGSAGPLAALFFVIGFNALYFIPVIIFIGYSRILLKCHNFPQVAAGVLTGFISTYIQMWIFILLS